MAVALIDRLGKPFRVNNAAERLLGPDLQVVEGRITSTDHEATATLDRALHALLWKRAEQPLAPPVVLPRAEKRPLLAYALRPPAICADALSACQAVLVLIDPECVHARRKRISGPRSDFPPPRRGSLFAWRPGSVWKSPPKSLA